LVYVSKNFWGGKISGNFLGIQVLLCVSYGALYIHIGHMRFKENSTVIDAIVWLYYAIETFYGVMREEIIIKLTNSVTYVNFKKFGLQVWELRYKTT